MTIPIIAGAGAILVPFMPVSFLPKQSDCRKGGFPSTNAAIWQEPKQRSYHEAGGEISIAQSEKSPERRQYLISFVGTKGHHSAMDNGHPNMPLISSEDVESVRGAMLTLPPLSRETDFLWTHLLEASLNQRGGLTASEICNLRYPGPANLDARLDSYKDSLRKVAGELDARLAPLLGYGFAVKVKHKRNLYSLEILKEGHRPASEGWFDHEFKWSVGGSDLPPRNLPVWVPIHQNGQEIAIKYRPLTTPWSPPPGFSGYEAFRDVQWASFEKRHKHGPRDQCWCVQRFLPLPRVHGRRGIELMLASVPFPDIVATTLHLDEPELPGPDANDGERTIRSWLQKYPCANGGAIHACGLTHFFPAANPLTVDVNVLTSDRHFVFRWYENSPSRRWEPAIFGYVDSLVDVYRNALHVPDPSETVFRKSCELLGIPILPARVCWLGVGFGLTWGRVSLFGEITISQTAAEINRLAKPLGLKTVKATPEEVHNQLHLRAPVQANHHRHHFEVLLALSLARLCERKVNIVTSTTPTDKLETELKRRAEIPQPGESSILTT